MPYVSDIGVALVNQRKSLGWSQAALASLLGVKRQQVQRWESEGYRKASLDAVSRAAEALGWTPTVESDQRLSVIAAESRPAYSAGASAAGTPPVRDLGELIVRVRAHAHELEQRFAVTSVAVFGSFARGEQTPDSDVDLIVEVARPTVENVFGAEELLESILGRATESGSMDALNPRIRQHLLKEVVRVWPA